MSDTQILIIDDDREQRQAIASILEVAGYQPFVAANGAEALDLMAQQLFALVISDVAMPNMNGYQFLESVRQEKAWLHIPVLFLSGRQLDSDIRFGKALGADDYLIKPIMAADLLAVVQGKLLRAQQLQRITEALPVLANNQSDAAPVRPDEANGLVVDEARHRVWQDGKAVKLSAREFRLLAILARHAGEVVPTTDILKYTHALESDMTEAGSLLRPMIRSIRRKLGYQAGETGCIENVRGVGYRYLTPADI